MGPIFSPGVPHTGRVASAGPGKLGAAIRLARHSLRQTAVFLPLLLCWSSSAVVAQTPAHVNFQAESFWTFSKWYVFVAVTTFLVQAFFIVWLLITRTRRRQAETESGRL